MKLDRRKLLLYAVTDRAWLDKSTLLDKVKAAIDGGVTFVQLREKHISDSQMLELALSLLPLCRRQGVPFVINDNVKVALKSGADGVHIGQDDMALKEARRQLGDDKIIGVSAHTVDEAVAAEKGGADYLGVGAVFGTSTKADAGRISFKTLSEIVKAVSIPVVAIGGINAANILQLKGSGICGAAVVSALFSKPDVAASASELKAKLKTVVA